MCDQQSTTAAFDFSTISCAELYEMCVAGDETAWRYLYNYILVIVRAQGTIAPDTPEDVAQDIALRLTAKGLDSIKNPKAFRGYVKTMIRNLFIDRLRQHAPSVVPLQSNSDDESGPVDPPSTAPGPDAIAQGNALFKLLQSQMEKLTRGCGDILKVYFNYKINGQPKNYQEMAAQFGLSVGGAGVRIKRCLEQLCAFPSIRSWMDDILKVTT